MGTSNDTTRRIAETSLFRQCSRRERSRARSLGTVVDVGPGSLLLREGDAAAEFYVVLDGEATVSAGGAPVGVVRTGHFFGEVGLLARAPRATTVTARTPMALLVFTRHEFRALLDVAPSVPVEIMRVHARRGSVARPRLTEAHDPPILVGAGLAAGTASAAG